MIDTIDRTVGTVADQNMKLIEEKRWNAQGKNISISTIIKRFVDMDLRKIWGYMMRTKKSLIEWLSG